MTSEKSGLRKSMHARRASLTPDALHAASEAVAAYGVDWLLAAGAPSPARVSSYRAIGSELDPIALEQALVAVGWTLCLPVMVGKAQPLQFRSFGLGDQLAPTIWDIQQPLASAAIVEPDVLLVPLLGFDIQGNRLGYGGGFYDRTLAALRLKRSIIAVGLGLDEQCIDAVPHCDYDERLDWVLTPSGPIPCR